MPYPASRQKRRIFCIFVVYHKISSKAFIYPYNIMKNKKFAACFPILHPCHGTLFFYSRKKKTTVSQFFPAVRGLFPIFLRLVHRPGDVRPVIFVGKGDLLHCLICVFSGFLHSGSVGSHAQYPAAVGDDLALAVETSYRSEYIVILFCP